MQNFEVGEVVFFAGKVSPWFWHKGVISKIDEEKGLKIGKLWYSESAVMKDTPQMADGLFAINMKKSMMMFEGGVQYEGESLDSYLDRNRKNKEAEKGEQE